MKTNIKTLLTESPVDTEVVVKGWIRTKRGSKQVSFLEINDGSCFASMQVILDNKNFSDEILQKLRTGTSVKITGKLVESPAPQQPVELQGSKVKIYGEAAPDYQLQKKRHSFEFLREIAHLRTRTNTFGAVFRIRNILAKAVHDFFQERNFIYLHSPIITTSDCEGAGEMFKVTNFDLNNIPLDKANNVDWEQDFFGKMAGLSVSGQLEAEIFACSLGDCYTFGPTFRAENSNTSYHLSEFWMVEPEIAFGDLEDDMDLAEDFIRYLFKAVLDKGKEDLEFFNKRISKGKLKALEKLATSPFNRISYSEAISKLEKKSNKFEFKPKWGMDLQTEHERYLTEKVFKGPVFVTDYPKEIKAFYMRMNDDGKTVAAMDALLPAVGEIIGGSQREERYEVLANRINEMELDLSDYDWYLDLRKYGTIPHSGFGLGFGRMVQFVTGMKNIRDIIPFPRTPGNAKF
ncbi:MAG: asparagine--tRNA ligase [Myxococcota bacterium]